MKRIFLSMLAVSALVFTSCTEEEPINPPKPEVKAPATYSFTKDGKSTVSFTGQVARLKMAGELKSALNVGTSTQAKLTEMFKDGKGFADATLNSSGKKLRSTVASATYSKLTTAQSEALRGKMDSWILDFTTNVQPKWTTDASMGKAGRLAYQKSGKTAYRYVNKKGIEINQAVAKTMIGAVIADQMVNKYVSADFIKDAKADNTAGKPYKTGKNYTKLEHGWDEAYGYLFGLEDDTTKPVNSTSARKGFLNSYLKSVEADADFKGIFDDINNAFKLGRAAIVAKQYDVVEEQAKIIRTVVSKVIAIRTVYYLLKGRGAKTASTLHALSEGYGFAHAMKFVHAGGAQINSRMDSTIAALEKGNGLWSITDDELTQLANKLASYYDFTTEQVL